MVLFAQSFITTLFYLGHHLKLFMKLQIKILQDFHNPLTRKLLKAGSLIEIEADAQGVPTHSFWYEQLRFEQNKSFFQIQLTTKKTKKD